MKKLLVTVWLVLIFSGVSAIFWYTDMVYQLPTPIPVGYKPVSLGTTVNLKGLLNPGHSKPVFLHFFNPECPCSRFNIVHFKSLVKEYGQQVDFAIVVISNKGASVKQVQDKFGLSIPVLFDSSLAAACGVYSTPQAALLDTAHKLYYRGNYNQARYCTDEKTSYAKIALTQLLQGYASPSFSPLAIKAYGCQLVSCKK